MIENYRIKQRLPSNDKRIQNAIVKNLKINQYYMMKQVFHSFFEAVSMSLIYNQMEALENTKGNGIVEYEGKLYDANTDSLCFFFEFMNLGSLKMDIMKRRKCKTPFEENLLIYILVNVCEGLKYFHDQNMFYGNLRSSSILLKTEGTERNRLGITAKLKPRVIKQLKAENKTIEKWEIKEEQKADIMNLGKILFKCMRAGQNCMNLTDTSLLPSYIDHYFSGSYSQPFRDLVKTLMDGKKNLIPRVEDIINLRFIKQSMSHSTFSSEDQNPRIDLVRNSNASILTTSLVWGTTKGKGKGRKINIQKQILRDIIHLKGSSLKKVKNSETSTQAPQSNNDIPSTSKKYSHSNFLLESTPISRFSQSPKKVKAKQFHDKKQQRYNMAASLSKLFKKHSMRSKSTPTILLSKTAGIIKNHREKLDKSFNKLFRPRKPKAMISGLAYSFKEIDKKTKILDKAKKLNLFRKKEKNYNSNSIKNLNKTKLPRFKGFKVKDIEGVRSQYKELRKRKRLFGSMNWKKSI